MNRCRKECVGVKCHDGCRVYPVGVARSTPELIRAYERGANRTLLLEEALLSNRNRGEELPDELVDRLFMRPSGEALAIPAWHEGGEEPFDVAVLAGALNTDQDPLLALFVFDDEVCLLYSSCSYNSPVEFDIKICPRTACFEAFARRVHLGEVAPAATPDEDDTWLASEETFSDEYRPFAIAEPLRGTACQKYERRASWPIAMVSTAVDMLLEAFDGRRLVTWSYFFFADRQNNAPWPPWGPPCPGPDIQFSKLVLHMYLQLFEDLEEDLPAPGTLRRARNWGERGPHILRRALFDKRRATTGKRRAPLSKDALFGKFLYETSPTPMFRLILSFL